jgi:S-adenosylmethionine:tRNA ribosyltransferase-isomerase
MSLLAEPVPSLAEAGRPPESGGLGRDAVRLLAVSIPDGEIRHAGFADLPDLLEPGDLIVINTSGTRAAALRARREDGRSLTVHLSSPAPGRVDGHWVVELRDGDRPLGGGHEAERLTLPAGGGAQLIAPYRGSRLWLAALRLPEPVDAYLSRHGRPIRYSHVNGAPSLSDYQNVYVTQPGSAEMPSAGRPFTPELITSLIARGIDVAPVLLHAGVSSLERDEPPYPERFHVPVHTSSRVELTHRLRRRVLAVGTTVVRALESAIAEDGRVHPTRGWTDLVLGPETGVHAVDAILTGFHDPNASHLRLLEAIAGPDLVARSYRVAAEAGYRRHEFGDLQLIMPRSGIARR